MRTARGLTAWEKTGQGPAPACARYGSNGAAPVKSVIVVPGAIGGLRQRIEAAVKAERAEAAQEQKHTTEPPRGVTASGSADSDLATLAVKQANGHSKRSAKPESAVRFSRPAKPEYPTKPERATQPARSARAGRAAEPQSMAKVEPAAKPEPSAENGELTARLAPAAKPQRATKTEPAVRPQPAEGRSAAPKPAVAPARTSRSAARKPAVPRKLGRRRIRAGLVSLVLVGFVVGSLGVVAATHLGRSPSKVTSPSAAVLRQEAVNRRQTATWVAEQVSHDVTVSCNKVMCAVLEAHGFPLRNLVVLGPTSHADPVPSVVVVETVAVRDMFGSSLATAWAPAVLASFGSGIAGSPCA